MTANSDHPNLTHNNHFETSPYDTSYNCVAWASNDTSTWYEPDEMYTHFWPNWAPRDYTLSAYLKVFTAYDYQICESGDLEPGFEKLAFFTKHEEVTHVARQLETGYWTSKMGMNVDMEHTLCALGGGRYGSVTAYLKKRRANMPSLPTPNA